jgi:hypothetical protein
MQLRCPPRFGLPSTSTLAEQAFLGFDADRF